MENPVADQVDPEGPQSDPGQQAGVIRVVCVDDHAFVLEGLRARLRIEPDIEVAAVISEAAPIVATAAACAPCVVLLDIQMPGIDCFAVIEDITARCPAARPALLSAYVRDSYIDAAVRAGAWGYLSKRDEPSTIVDAIRRIAAGRFAFSEEVLDRCGGAPPQPGEPSAVSSSKLGALTPRELQILRLIGEGLGRSEIAEAIHRSPKTVDAHRASIMEKLGLHDRVELARFAIREGLAEL